ncbi:MAG: regulatory iron-sulfur-containing complex subunit RicT [Deltaproteobacteria bacterium]|nr:regulatory iron-sulfur-containing complex subunit RicT [Deltaproteobacteria bacterium]
MEKNEQVIVNTENGTSLGTVITEVKSVPIYKLPIGLKNVVRKATDDDLRTKKENEVMEQEARQFCLEKIRERELPMKLIEVECLFDKSQIIFYFTAESRVDFRELVKDLVQRFKIRIELRQIGARHEARLVKGLGICGREVCCANLILNLDRVSVKMAKEQSVSLNPEKISGLCGRLMCCLAFEFDVYQDLKRDIPKCGKMINTAEGRGKIIRQNIFKGEIVVILESGKEITVNIEDL